MSSRCLPIEHGEFLPWIKRHCEFSQQSASNYIRLFTHRSKSLSAGDLQDAYREVAQIESREKQTEARAKELPDA